MGNTPANLIPVKFTSPARILSGSRAGLGTAFHGSGDVEFDVDYLMSLAKKRAQNPARFDDNPPFFWLDQMSSDVIDSYFTRMHETTLRNFAQHATDGISFQYSHDWHRLGLGYSLMGRFEQLAGKDPANIDPTSEFSQRALGYFFTVPGIRMNAEMSTDDFIVAVETGVLQDVSVGFYAESMTCSVCGGDMFSGWFGGIYGRCDHYPGLTYEDPYVDAAGKKYGGDVLCYAWVNNGTLSELSQVYDGATPGAGHLKAEIFSSEGALDARTTRMLEAHYRIKLPGGAIVQRSPGMPGTDGRNLDMRGKRNEENGVTVAEENDDLEPTESGVEIEGITDDESRSQEGADEPTEETPATTEDERTMLDNLQARWGEEGITLATTARETIDGLCRAIVRLRAEAKDGRAYRKDVRASALRAAAAAFGKDYDQKRYESLVDSLPVSEVKTLTETWEAMAGDRFPGGRKSSDPSDDKHVAKASSQDWMHSG